MSFRPSSGQEGSVLPTFEAPEQETHSFELRLTALENAFKKRESGLHERIVLLEMTILKLYEASNEASSEPSSTKPISLSWPEVKPSSSESSLSQDASAAGHSKVSDEKNTQTQVDLVTVEMLQDLQSNNPEVDDQLEQLDEEAQKIEDKIKNFKERLVEVEEESEITTH